jgi:hypothetical protein
VALPPEDPKSLSCRSFKTALCRARDLSLPSTYRAAESHELELLHRNSRTNLILKLEGCRARSCPLHSPTAIRPYGLRLAALWSADDSQLPRKRPLLPIERVPFES